MTAENLVFIDESGVNTAFMRSHARSRRGTRVVDNQPKRRGTNLSLIGALGPDGMVASHLLDGSMRKAEFLRFLQEALLPKLKPGTKIVMDNLRIHHSEEARRLVAESGVELLFIPPYSPRFNPIEHAWSKLKAFLRKVRARTTNTLVDAVKDGIKRITKSDAQGWIRHSGYPLAPGSS